VRLRRADQSAEIQVIDTGKGIPDSALRFVFDQFWQADGDSSTQPDRGVGLGLSIAKHLVMAHGGRIDVTSAGDGQGSTFTVRLPLALTPPVNEATSRMSVSMLFDGAPVTEIDGGTVAEEVNHTPGRPSLDAVSS
jgi:K+-sensing histidine kinase KdpD